jgi:hypothetical protein
MGQIYRATNHLVGMLGVDTEANGNVHTFIEFGRGFRLDLLNRNAEVHAVFRVEPLADCEVALALLV